MGEGDRNKGSGLNNPADEASENKLKVKIKVVQCPKMTDFDAFHIKWAKMGRNMRQKVLWIDKIFFKCYFSLLALTLYLWEEEA